MATLYLIGDPVAHSMSPAMQNAAFAAMGLPHRYELLPARVEDLPAVIDRVRRDDVLGGNVTIPHKERIGRLLDVVEETAQRIGAVNTIFKRGRMLRGDNTDAGGFSDALYEKRVDVNGRRVLLLGAGGAARACADGLVRAGAQLDVANRSRARADTLAQWLMTSSVGTVPRSVGVVGWPPRSLSGHDVVVNATSLGLHAEDALDGMALPPEIAVVDIVATKDETPLVRRARVAGCVAVDGLIMLLHQGARAFRLWTGLDAPLAAMRAALPRPV